MFPTFYTGRSPKFATYELDSQANLPQANPSQLV